MPDYSADNLQQLQAIQQSAIVLQLIDLTKNCFLVWNQTSPNAYAVSKGRYDFYLNQTSSNTYVLSVLFLGGYYRSYDSDLLPEVASLFQVVDIMYTSTDELQTLKQIVADIGQAPACVSSQTPLCPAVDPCLIAAIPMLEGQGNSLKDFVTCTTNSADNVITWQQTSMGTVPYWSINSKALPHHNFSFSLPDLSTYTLSVWVYIERQAYNDVILGIGSAGAVAGPDAGPRNITLYQGYKLNNGVTDFNAPPQLYFGVGTPSPVWPPFQTSGFSGETYATIGPCPVNQWLHCVCVRDTKNKLDTFYFNGVQSPSIGTPFVPASNPTGGGPEDFSTFTNAGLFFGWVYQGKICNFLLWDRTLSSDEVQNLYNYPWLLYSEGFKGKLPGCNPVPIGGIKSSVGVAAGTSTCSGVGETTVAPTRGWRFVDSAAGSSSTIGPGQPVGTYNSISLSLSNVDQGDLLVLFIYGSRIASTNIQPPWTSTFQLSGSNNVSWNAAQVVEYSVIIDQTLQLAMCWGAVGQTGGMNVEIKIDTSATTYLANAALVHYTYGDPSFMPQFYAYSVRNSGGGYEKQMSTGLVSVPPENGLIVTGFECSSFALDGNDFIPGDGFNARMVSGGDKSISNIVIDDCLIPSGTMMTDDAIQGSAAEWTAIGASFLAVALTQP